MDVKYSFSLQAISCEFVTFSLSMIISSVSLFDDSVPLFLTERICCQIVLVSYDQLLSLRIFFVWRFVSMFLLSFCIAYILPSFVFFYYNPFVVELKLFLCCNSSVNIWFLSV